ncbi:MAG: methyltransferase domain-containing protein, partial [Syntrophorhabdus sp.]
PDLLCDVLEGLPYPDSTIDMIRADDFLEHIPIGKTVQVITEIWRVLKPGGIFESSTPSTDGRGAFMDPTHVSFWNCNSWLYYSDPQYRGLYGIKADFEIESIEDKEINPGMGIVHTHVIGRARK